MQLLINLIMIVKEMEHVFSIFKFADELCSFHSITIAMYCNYEIKYVSSIILTIYYSKNTFF